MPYSLLLTGMPKLKSRLYVCGTCGRRQRSMRRPECPRRGCYRRWMTLAKTP